MKQTGSSCDCIVAAEFDVIVAGGGCAGVTAAIAAARNGAKTLLIERESYLGGMLTGGLVHSLHGYRVHRDYVSADPFRSWDTAQVVEGITMEIVKRLRQAGGTNLANPEAPSVRENYDEEVMAFVLDQMAEEAGVTVLFNAFAYEAVMDGRKVTGVRVASKSGSQYIKSAVVVDCSGDGDLCVSAGCGYEVGSPESGVTHGAALMMEVGGIDLEKTIEYLKNRPELTGDERERFIAERNDLINGGTKSPDTILKLDGTAGKFDMGGKPQSWESIEEGIRQGRQIVLHQSIEREWIEYVKAHPEMPHMPNTRLEKPCYPRAPKLNWMGIIRNGKMRFDQFMSGVHEAFVDQSDAWAMSKVISLMRKIDFYYMDFLRTSIPGFEEAYIIKTSPLVGTRESRRITGISTLTAQDCENGVQKPDGVALSGRACNIHHMNGQNGLRYWVEPKNAYSIPYGCLVPKDADGIMTSGRCASTDFIALGATRSMPTCMSMGEAAGAAAALCAAAGCEPRELDVSKLREALIKQGVMLSE